MSTNAQIARMLEEIADLQEIAGKDSFRVSSNRRAARSIESLADDCAQLAADPPRLLAIEGVGKGVAAKIHEFLDTGSMQELEDLRAEVPPGLLRILAIPGVGGKTVRAIWTTLNVTSVDELRKAIADGSILTVPRMGRKTVDNMLAAIEFVESAGARVPLGKAAPIGESIADAMRAVKGVSRAECAGSLRRGRDTIGDIDVLVCAADPAAASKAFRAMPGVEEVLASGETKSSVRFRAEGGQRIQVDLRVVDKQSFGAALLYFTGSKEHNVRLRERALAQGLTLNEYGLFPDDPDQSAAPHKRGVAPVAAATEEEIYHTLSLPWIPPELREDSAAELKALDGRTDHDFELIQTSDIRAELHAHTTASDGRMSIEELAERAKARGFHTIAVTDHSKSSVIANGLDEERLRAHAAAVREAAARTKGIRILAGAEVDILADGSLDYDDDTLRQLDIVVASPHAALNQDAATATKRLIRAVEHPLVHVLGHPTGRLLNRREGLHPDIRALAKAAADAGTALEVNAHWLRLDLRDAHIRAALDEGAIIAIDCDVHKPEHFDSLRFGVTTARRAGLTPDRCVNCWTKTRLDRWLKAKR